MQCPLCRQPLTPFAGDWVCPTHGPVRLSAADPAGRTSGCPIFLSYGRKDAAPIAERLADDLPRHGHPVWIDRRAIEAGAPWDVRIEQGIRGAAVVLAVLTPHALREDSVCRNEIVFALNEGKRVVPLQTAAGAMLKPPLLLGNRNWVDFSAGYERGLAELLRFLGGDETALRPPGRFAIAGTTPLDFSVELARFAAGFTGRAWLATELGSWLAGGRRALVLVGEPGLGKSAIAAWLHRHRPESLAIHFCTRGNTRSLDPYVFVASLVQQLYARLPGYAEAVERRQPEARRPTAGDAFRELIVEPARELAGPDGPRLFVADALDESMTSAGETIADVLVEQAADLPAWLRVVATTRPEPAVLERVRALGIWEVQADRDENRRDVALYLRQRLSAPALAGRLGGAADALAERVERLAEGNFLYARMTLEALEDGSLSPADVGRLSAGLSQFFAAAFRRRFPSPPVYSSIHAPLLRALAVARGPLPLGLLQRLTGQSAEVLHSSLRELRSYLRTSGSGPSAGCALFHKSLREWLTDAESAGPYWCDPSAGHSQLADALLPGRAGDDYALRHLPAHLAGAGRGDELANVLCELPFLEAKAAAGLVFELAGDFAEVLRILPATHPRRHLLRLLEEGLRRDIHFLGRHPSALLQCLWNSGWWYDCPQAADHYEPPEEGWPAEGPPWQRPGPRLCALLEEWRAARKRTDPGLVWVRSLRPPAQPLGTAQRAVLRGHEGSVCAVAVSPDGRRIASASKDRTVRVWDAASGAEALCLRGHRDWVTAVVFSPDGRRLVTASSDRTLRVWDAAGGRETACLRGHVERICDIALSPDGGTAISGSEDWTVRLWDLASGREVRCCRLRGLSDEGAALSVAFAPDGRTAVSGLRDGSVLVWDVAGSAPPRRLLAHEGSVCAAAFAADGRLATAGAEGTVCLWEPAGWRRTASFRPAGGQDASIARLAFSPDGRRLACAAADRNVYVCTGDGGEAARLRGHERGVGAVAFSPDGGRLVSGSNDGTVRVWDAAGGAAAGRLRGHADHLRVLAFSPDGRHLATGGEDRMVWIWDVLLGTQRASHEPAEASIRSLAFSPDGRRLVWGTEDGVVCMGELAGGPPVLRMLAHRGAVFCLAFSPDGRRLASGSWEGEVHVRDAGDGRLLARLVGHTDRVWHVAFSADGSGVTSESADGTVRTWDAVGGACLHVRERTGSRAESGHSPWRAVVRGLETVIETPAGAAAASLPEAPALLRAHPSGRLWAGAAGSHLHLFLLEGGTGDRREA